MLYEDTFVAGSMYLPLPILLSQCDFLQGPE